MSIGESPQWLLLIHQLPAKPAYARVKIWRRLQALGAVTVKGSVYALPANAETREDFAWLAKEIVESGGEAIVCEAALVDGLSDRELQALFDAARDEDYRRIAAEARDVASRLGDDLPDNALAEIASQTARLRKQLDAVVAIDFSAPTGGWQRRAWCQVSRPLQGRKPCHHPDSFLRLGRSRTAFGSPVEACRSTASPPLADPAFHRQGRALQVRPSSGYQPDRAAAL
jgi:hypothetical protein